MEHQEPSPRRRLPGQAEPGPDEVRAASRDRGLRHVRRLSNWTAAALVAATGITAGYFSHATAHAPRPAAATGVQSQARGSNQPCVTVPVATSGGSGVTAATVPSSCAAGQNKTQPPVVYMDSHEGGDQ
jgi:hypothetical protein